MPLHDPCGVQVGLKVSAVLPYGGRQGIRPLPVICLMNPMKRMSVSSGSSKKHPRQPMVRDESEC
eukprot:30032-Eustigmatos_ZCMA.PRE.1